MLGDGGHFVVVWIVRTDENIETVVSIFCTVSHIVEDLPEQSIYIIVHINEMVGLLHP